MIGSNKFNRDVLKSIEIDVIITESSADLKYKEKLVAMERGPSVYNQIVRNGLVGIPEMIVERVKEYIDAGVGQFFLPFNTILILKLWSYSWMLYNKEY